MCPLGFYVNLHRAVKTQGFYMQTVKIDLTGDMPRLICLLVLPCGSSYMQGYRYDQSERVILTPITIVKLPSTILSHSFTLNTLNQTYNATRKWSDLCMNMWCRKIYLTYIAQLLTKKLWYTLSNLSTAWFIEL